jgi:tetratricopeptide (TPR) repeat protein
MKLKLHITKAQKDVQTLRNKLQNWDPLAYQQEQAAKNAPPPPTEPKKGRKGPETWKLKGAARPAWQVYDFDTRYVDPYAAAHDAARAKAGRIQNLVAVYRGKFGRPTKMDHHDDNNNRQPEMCREFLSALMRLGNLYLENRQYRLARQVFLECIELEGDDDDAEQNPPITSARESLMELYLQVPKYDSALRLGERFPSDASVFFRYSAALAAVQLRSEKVHNLMAHAIRSNVFVAYYLSYYETFANVMEYLEDIQNAKEEEDNDDERQSSFEEALEYCGNPDTIQRWLQIPNSMDTLKHVLQSGINGTTHDTTLSLQVSDLDWNSRLAKIEQEYHDRHAHSINNVTEDDDNNESSDHLSTRKGRDESDIITATTTTTTTTSGVDLPMFAKMFRTAMEILEHSGEST